MSISKKTLNSSWIFEVEVIPTLIIYRPRIRLSLNDESDRKAVFKKRVIMRILNQVWARG